MKVTITFMNLHKGITRNVKYVEGLDNFNLSSFITLITEDGKVESIPKEDIKNISIRMDE